MAVRIAKLHDRLDRTKTAIHRLIEVLENGLGFSDGIRDRLFSLEQEKQVLEQKIAAAEAVTRSSKLKIDAAFAENGFFGLKKLFSTVHLVKKLA